MSDMGNKVNKEIPTTIIEELPSKENEQEKTVEQTKMEDKSTIVPQIVAGVIVNLSLLACGICFSWPTPVLPQLQNNATTPLHLTKDKEILVVGAVSIGACVGPILSALLIDKIGRKWVLYLTGIPFLVCWACIYMAKTWVLLFVGRLIAGLSVGIIFTMVPVYLGEIVETKIRGAISTMMAFSLNVGYLIVYAVGPQVNMKMLTLVCVAPTILFGVTAIWLPESPYYYMKNKKEKCAELALIWLRGKKENREELKEISDFIEGEKGGSFKELFTEQVNRKALLLVLLLLAGQQLSGLLAIQSYASSLITDLNLNFSTNNVLIAIGLLTVVMSIVSIFIMDKIGRKPLFLVAGYISGLCLCFLGAFFFINKNYMKLDKFSYAPLAATVLYYTVTFIGLGPMPAVVSSEIFSVKIKSWATMVANIFGSLLGIIVTMSYRLVIDALGYHAIFFAFGILELIIATVAVFVMPETKCKSFIRIQNMLRKRNPECKTKNEHTTSVKFDMDTEEKQ